jgi:hypothetical protein
MEVLQSLNLPSVGSLENLASFGMSSFPSCGNLSSGMSMMTWEHSVPPHLREEHETTQGDQAKLSGTKHALESTASHEVCRTKQIKREEPPGDHRRVESSLTSTHLHMPRNSSIEDFLSLVANGDIPPVGNECLNLSMFSSGMTSGQSQRQSESTVTVQTPSVAYGGNGLSSVTVSFQGIGKRATADSDSFSLKRRYNDHSHPSKSSRGDFSSTKHVEV